jgi:hypothetical protein
MEFPSCNVPIKATTADDEPNHPELKRFVPQKRQDVFPNDPTSVVITTNRHDAPYSELGDITWKGTLARHTKLPDPRINDKQFIPFVGFLKNEDRANVLGKQGFVMPTCKIAKDGFVQVAQK